METQVLKAGQIVKVDGIPARLLADAQVECGTELHEFSDTEWNEMRQVPRGHAEAPGLVRLREMQNSIASPIPA